MIPGDDKSFGVNDVLSPVTPINRLITETELGASGGGDMLKSNYDPNTKTADAFSMDNMDEGTDTKILTATERTEIAKVADKVDKVAGKGLSANDFTNTLKTKLDSVEADATADQTANEVAITTIIGSPSHGTNIQSMNQLVNTSGVVSGSDLIDHDNGTVTIETGTAFLRSTSDSREPLFAVEVAQSEVLSLVDDSMNFIYVEYNGGTPQFGVTQVQSYINCQDRCLAYIVHREGNILHYIDDRQHGIDVSKKTRGVFRDFSYFIHAQGGSVLSEPADLAIGLTAGRFYYTVTKLDHTAFNTSVAGTESDNVFKLSYRDDSGGWTTQVEQKVIDTNTYDDDTGTPATLGNSKYGVSWVYMVHNAPSDLHIIMGQEEYASRAAAEVATVPSEVPSIITGLGSLVGFVVYQKGSTSFDNVLSAFAQTFTGSAPTNHNNLAGLQGGALGDYQHLTTAQVALVDGSVQNTGDTMTGALEVRIEDAVNNDFSKALLLSHKTTGTPANGIGVRIDFEAEDDGGNVATIGYIKHRLVDVTDGAEKSTMSFSTRNGGSISDKMTIDEVGNIGIGTNSADELLHTKKTNGDNFLKLENSGDTNYSGIFFTRETSAAEDQGGAYIRMQSNTANTTGILEFGVGSNINSDTATTDMVINNNKIGVGTTEPDTILHVTTEDNTILRLENSATALTTDDRVGEIDFYANDGSTNGTGAKVNIKAVVESTAGTLVGLSLGTSDSTSATAVERVRISASGNIEMPTVGASITMTSSNGVTHKINRTLGSLLGATVPTSIPADLVNGTAIVNYTSKIELTTLADLTTGVISIQHSGTYRLNLSLHMEFDNVGQQGNKEFWFDLVDVTGTPTTVRSIKGFILDSSETYSFNDNGATILTGGHDYQMEIRSESALTGFSFSSSTFYIESILY